MDEVQAIENDANQIDEQLGQDAPPPEEANTEEQSADTDPHGVKKRLGQMGKKYDRMLREQQRVIDALQHELAQARPQQTPFSSPGQPDPVPATEEDRIKQAVMYALTEKDRAAQAEAERQKLAHVQKQYQRLESEFDNAYDKYPDFHEKVMAHDVPFTAAMRDAMLLIDNPADVAYSLANKREELQRIAALHPLDQAREVNRLSRALERGQTAQPQGQAANRVNPIGSLRTNPANNSAVTDKTSAAAIRSMMKNGTWK